MNARISLIAALLLSSPLHGGGIIFVGIDDWVCSRNKNLCGAIEVMAYLFRGSPLPHDGDKNADEKVDMKDVIHLLGEINDPPPARFEVAFSGAQRLQCEKLFGELPGFDVSSSRDDSWGDLASSVTYLDHRNDASCNHQDSCDSWEVSWEVDASWGASPALSLDADILYWHGLSCCDSGSPAHVNRLGVSLDGGVLWVVTARGFEHIYPLRGNDGWQYRRDSACEVDAVSWRGQVTNTIDLGDLPLSSDRVVGLRLEGLRAWYGAGIRRDDISLEESLQVILSLGVGA
jgi:hypothetical protein